MGILNINKEEAVNLKNFQSSATITYSLTLLVILFLNIFMEIRPITDYFNLLERSNLFFLIPLSFLLPVGLFLFDKVRYKKLMDEKEKLFNKTVQIVQDIVYGSNTKTQLLITGMQQANVDDELLNSANEIFARSNSLLNSLYKLNSVSIRGKNMAEIIKEIESISKEYNK